MKIPRPNFFILGAPKCGTTSLASWLSGHPRIYMSPVKEPHFFSKDFNRGHLNSLDQYERLFRGAKGQHCAVGEASTEYLYSDCAVSLIEQTYPDSKYIVMFRNPADLVFSLYRYEKEPGREDAASFEEAWILSGDRRIGKFVPKRCTDGKWLDYKSIAFQGRQLERLYKAVGSDRVKILLLEDVRNDPLSQYKQTLEFLNVEYDGKIDFFAENISRTSRSKFLIKLIHALGRGSRSVKRIGNIPEQKGTGVLNYLRRINSKISDYEPLDEDLRNKIIAHYEDDIRLLSDLICRDLSHWRNP